MKKLGWCKECSVYEGHICENMNDMDDFDIGQCCYSCDKISECSDSCKRYIRYDSSLKFNGRNYWKCENFNESKEEVQKGIIKENFDYDVSYMLKDFKEIENKYGSVDGIDKISSFIGDMKKIIEKYEEI